MPFFLGTPIMNTITLDVTSANTDKTELIRLVRAAQRGDRQAFGELFERFERHVMAIALRRLGDYGEAQELCQDVFIQAMKKIRQLREPEAFAGWLRSITNRMAINRLVRKPADRAIQGGGGNDSSAAHSFALAVYIKHSNYWSSCQLSTTRLVWERARDLRPTASIRRLHWRRQRNAGHRRWNHPRAGTDAAFWLF